MKRTLILVRHGKSSWEEGSLADRERPLAARGRHDAPLMGGRLAREGVKPDLILSSPACRALSTARLVAHELGYPPDKIAIDERLYEGDVGILLSVMGELADGLMSVLLVGHDPAFSALAHRFSSGITRMPTCAVARFVFEVDSWEALATQPPRSAVVDYPKKGQT